MVSYVLNEYKIGYKEYKNMHDTNHMNNEGGINFEVLSECKLGYI